MIWKESAWEFLSTNDSGCPWNKRCETIVVLTATGFRVKILILIANPSGGKKQQMRSSLHPRS
jgi:hypothetical protein